jgi:hypothetical protein
MLGPLVIAQHRFDLLGVVHGSDSRVTLPGVSPAVR